MTRMKKLLKSMRRDEDGHAMAWGGGGLFTIVLIVVLLLIIF